MPKDPYAQDTTECLHASPEYRGRPTASRFPLIHDRFVRGTDALGEPALCQLEACPQGAEDAVEIVGHHTGRRHCDNPI